MNKESKLNLDAGDYAIRHCIIDQTYNGLEVHKMLCDAYIAGNNDTLEDDDERIRKELLEYCKNQAKPYIYTGNECPQIQSWIDWLERQGTKLPVGFYYVNSDGKKFYSDTLKYGDVILHVENQSKQKREWSEEDEKTLNEIFSVAARASLRKSTLFGKSYDYIKWQNWLKSLKERMGG